MHVALDALRNLAAYSADLYPEPTSSSTTNAHIDAKVFLEEMIAPIVVLKKCQGLAKF